MDKTEWPTEYRLHTLRQEGVVPVSSFALRAAATFGAVFGLYMVFEKFLALGAKFEAIFEADTFGLLAVGSSFIQDSILILAAPVLGAFFATLITGFAQSRLLFLPGKISPSLSNLNIFQMPGISKILAEVGQLLGLILAAFLFGGVLLWMSGYSLLSLLNYDREYFISRLGEAQSLLIPIAAFLLLLALVAIFAERFLYRLRHRMSREEVQQEESGGGEAGA